jgi:hypothetical protein
MYVIHSLDVRMPPWRKTHPCNTLLCFTVCLPGGKSIHVIHSLNLYLHGGKLYPYNTLIGFMPQWRKTVYTRGVIDKLDNIDTG